MAEDKERFRRALDFMKMLGVSHSVVTPILKRLVKLYENEWSLIEEENYRALADSYFDEIESKGAQSSVRGTRKSSRRCTSNEIRAAELLVPGSTSPKKKANKRVTFSQFAEKNLNKGDDERSGERCEQMEPDSPIADAGRQDISCSYSQELQLECLSFKETAPNDLVNGERGHLRKPRTDAVLPSSASTKSELNVLPSCVASPSKVKEEPLELPTVMQKRDAPLSRLPLPAIMSTRNQDKQIVLFHNNNDSKVGSNEAQSTSIKEKKRRKVALLCHIEKTLQQKKEKDSLQNIATAYGSASDDDSGTLEKHGNMRRVRDCSHLKEKSARSAEVLRAASKNDSGTSEKDASLRLASNFSHLKEVCTSSAELTGAVTSNESSLKGGSFQREATSNLAAVTVKKEPACVFNSNGHSHTNPYLYRDISRGQERIPISVSNTLTNENLPPFTYIKNNITFQNAYVNFALARVGEEDCCEKCFGNCIEKYPPCHCARETGGEFAYDQHGRLRTSLLREAIADKQDEKSSSVRNKYCDKGLCLLNTGYCKGHLIRKFVKECWSKCRCGMECGNRVVQKGISQKLQVSYISKGRGWGLRTLEDLPAGTFVCEYVGEILTNVELDARNTARKGHSDHYPTLLDADLSSETILRDEELLCLDATYYGNVARFINHRCYDANLVDIPVEIESPDHHYYHIAFFTTRLVKALEELTWDYCIDFEDLTHPIKAFKCLCESQHCRGRHYKS